MDNCSLYEGPDRREHERRAYAPCDPCKHESTISALKDTVDELYGVLSIGRKEFDECKRKVEMDITTLHSDMAGLRSDVSTMRNDMHQLTVAVGDMRVSLAQIAKSLESMADLPDAWSKLKGWWAVMRWLRDNWFLLAIIFAMFVWTLP